jgi:hypothetical protein
MVVSLTRPEAEFHLPNNLIFGHKKAAPGGAASENRTSSAYFTAAV